MSPRAASVAAAVLFLALPFGASPAGSATIELRADPWCPFNCRPEAERPGYLIELARAVFEPLGHRVDYRLMGWRRAIEAVREGQIDGVVGAGVEDAPDLVFPDEPAGFAVPVLAVRRGEAFDPTDGGSLASRTIGAVLGYGFGSQLETHLQRHADDPRLVQWVSGTDAAVQNLRKLLAGRIDGAFDDRSVLLHYARELGGVERIELLELGDRQSIGLAFSPRRPESVGYARAFAEGVRHLRANGELARILARYGLADWRDASERSN